MIEEKVTFCRICEPLCGMVATVEDGRLTQLRPDKEHPLSRGFACPKGIAFAEVHNDPDRVTHPLRRTPDGDFEQVDWDTALDDIARRLGEIHGRHGADAIGWYFGNPSVFSYSHALWVNLFMLLLGARHVYSAGSQDVNNRLVASRLLYGTQLIAPVPDLTRTDLLVVVGANPLVSHGSVLTHPRIKDELHGIVERGGRVLVVDPRRTETARAFEWLPIDPDGDAFLLLSLLHVLFSEGLADRAVLDRAARGVAVLETLARDFPPEATAARTGIDAETVRALARDLAATERAAVYGRTGTSLGRSGTLTTVLLDAVNLVAGNLDREGGAMFGAFGVPGERELGILAQKLLPIGYERDGDLPRVLGTRPAAVMAKDIEHGPVRALFVSAGNPGLSVPNGEELERAVRGLDLFVSIDLYVNETNAHADYVLPATTMYERDDFPLAFQSLHLVPFRQATEAVVAPRGEAREEWQVVQALIDRLWKRGPQFALARVLARVATPQRLVDAVIRASAGGLARGGLSRDRLLRDHPHGKVLAPHLEPGMLRKVVAHGDRRVRLDDPAIAEEVARLRERADDPDHPLKLIGMRELRSENSWMHNAPLLARGGRVQRARMHPDDAPGLSDGDLVRITSRHGAIELPVELTEDLKPGVVAVPHGWGHKGTGGWRRANRLGGANVNQLMSTDPADLERLAGMAHLNGVPVRVEAAVGVA